MNRLLENSGFAQRYLESLSTWAFDETPGQPGRFQRGWLARAGVRTQRRPGDLGMGSEGRAAHCFLSQAIIHKRVCRLCP